MQGLALKNIEIKVRNQKKKVVFQEFGELLFTHFGLSGPLILSASAHMRNLFPLTSSLRWMRKSWMSGSCGILQKIRIVNLPIRWVLCCPD